jgi:hypothetical protein
MFPQFLDQRAALGDLSRRAKLVDKAKGGLFDESDEI